jgi:hypothetical protein
MNYRNKIKLQKAVEVLKALHFKPENIMVTGSIALDIQGLMPNRIAHDVDFIIKMDEQTWRCMKLIEAIQNSDKENINNYPDSNNITIITDNLKINIWKWNPEYDWSELKDINTGIYVATVNHIITAKKKYARDKDIVDIYNIVKNLL